MEKIMFNTPFSFKSPRHVIFGPGTSKTLTDMIISDEDSSTKSILVLSDQGVKNAGILEKILFQLSEYKKKLVVVDDIPTEPFEDDIQNILERYNGLSVSQIIAVGGGSVLDTAKLISHLLNSNSTVRSLRDEILPIRGVPVIMLPTTAGTGSEATPNSIIALREEEVKVGLVSEFFMPDSVILDPELTLSLPPTITAATGVDAFCHLLECYISKKSNPYSDTMALKGMTLALNSLQAAYDDGSNIEARSAMMMASYYGGACIASSGTTAVHALSYPLGGKFRIPHGVSNAILLVPVFDFIKDSISEKLTIVAKTIGLEDTTPEAFITFLKNLVTNLNIPVSVKEYGVQLSDLDYLAEKSFTIRRLLDSTPQELSIEDIKTIYRKIF